MNSNLHHPDHVGRITLEYWHRGRLNGTKLNVLPERPDGRTLIDEFSCLAGWIDESVVRIRGYVHPPQSGDYVFYTSDAVALYIGTDDNVASKREMMNASDRDSFAVHLEAGTSYCIEAVCTNSSSDKGLTVGWRLPDGTTMNVIPGTYLSPHKGRDGLPAAHRLLNGLSRQHPRLLASAYDFAVLRARIAQDRQVGGWYAAIKVQGEAYLAEPHPDYPVTDPCGYNIAGRANQLINIMETLGMIYNVEDDDGDLDLRRRCVDYAWDELEAISHFLSWDTEHYASTPRMAHAFAMGYDWMYDAFTPEQRAVIRKAIIELAIKPYAAELDKGPFGWHQWTIMKGNWNCVINGETGIALLAVAEETDYLIEDVLHKLLVNTLNYAMLTYYPDGGTKESPSYWWFKDVFFLPFLPSLESALGTDFGLGKVRGVAETGAFPLHAMGPSGQFFNYSDGNTGWQTSPGLMYLSHRYDKPLYAWTYREWFGDVFTPRSVLWWDTRGSRDDLLSLPLDVYFSDAEVAFMRGAWDEADTSWVGFAATDNYDFIHGQLDQGTFVFDALGERWVEDLGADNYGRPGYWDKDTGGIRWKGYRIRAEGHNTLVINPGTTHEDQHPMAKGKMIAFSNKGHDPYAIADLSDAYRQNGARRVRRGVKLVDRTSLLVCDEIQLEQSGEVWWFMHTQAEITVIADGQRAVLRKNGKQATVVLISASEGARLLDMPAERLPTSPEPAVGERGARKYRKLAIHAEGVSDVQLAVILMPDDRDVETSDVLTSLNSWICP